MNDLEREIEAACRGAGVSSSPGLSCLPKMAMTSTLVTDWPVDSIGVQSNPVICHCSLLIDHC